MTEKVKKDAKDANNNKRLIRVTGILVITVLLVYAVSTIVGGAFKDFGEAALLWVLIGIGVAASMTYFSQIESDGDRKQ